MPEVSGLFKVSDVCLACNERVLTVMKGRKAEAIGRSGGKQQKYTLSQEQASVCGVKSM